MGDVRKTEVSLSFSGDDLVPDEISAGLGLAPHLAYRRGETWHAPNGAARTGRTGVWTFRVASAAPPGRDLNDQIRELLSATHAELSVWTDLAQRFSGRLFVGVFLETFNDGLCIAPDVMLGIGGRGLRLDLDLYGCDDPFA